MVAPKLMALMSSETGLPWNTGIVHTQQCSSCNKMNKTMYRRCQDCSHVVCTDCFNKEGMTHQGLCRSGRRWFPTLGQEQQILVTHGARAPERPASLPEPANHRQDWRDWKRPGLDIASLLNATPAPLSAPVSTSAYAAPSTPVRKATASAPSPSSATGSLHSSSPTITGASWMPVKNPTTSIWEQKEKKKRMSKKDAEASPAAGRRKLNNASSSPVSKSAPAMPAPAMPAPAIPAPAPAPAKPVLGLGPGGLQIPATRQPVRKIAVFKASSTSSTSNVSNTSKEIASTKTSSATKVTAPTKPTGMFAAPKTDNPRGVGFNRHSDDADLGESAAYRRRLEEEDTTLARMVGGKLVPGAKELPSALRRSSTRTGPDRCVSFDDELYFDDDHEKPQPFIFTRESNVRNAPVIEESNERGRPITRRSSGRSELVFQESNERGQPITRRSSERGEPDIQESNERGRPVTRQPGERTAKERRARTPFPHMGTGTSDVNRLGPSTHARTENVVQKFHQATAASGVINLDVRGIDTLRIKTGPGFYLRTDESGNNAVLPAQMFYQWLGEGAVTLHQEFVLQVDDAENPEQELIGTRDIPTGGEFKGFEVTGEKMSDVQSAIISAQPRRRSERIAKPANAPEASGSVLIPEAPEPAVAPKVPKPAVAPKIPKPAAAKKNTGNRLFPRKKQQLAEAKLPVPKQVMGNPRAFNEDFGPRSRYQRDESPDYSDYMPGVFKPWSKYQ